MNNVPELHRTSAVFGRQYTTFSCALCGYAMRLFNDGTRKVLDAGDEESCHVGSSGTVVDLETDGTRETLQ